MAIKYKTLIAPFVAVIAITLQLVFGIEVGAELQAQIVEALVNVILVAVVIYGIFKNHFSEQ